MNKDLRTSIIKAGENMLNALNPEQNYTPYFRMDIQDDYTAYMRMTWPQHNLGRWWDAMLRLEAATGFELPVHIERAMLENYKSFFDNPDNLCFQPVDFEEKPFPLELHSLREWLLGLDALIKYRGNEWAGEKAHMMLETVRNIYDGSGGWNLEKLNYLKVCRGEMLKRHFDPVGSNGRFLEALVWHHTTTGDKLAMELAQEIAQFHYEFSTAKDGSINVQTRPDHLHSYLNTLQGLFLYGKKTGETKYIERVAKTYEITVQRFIKQSGYASHDIGNEAYVGETSSDADAVQLALWLAREGYWEFLDDAERIIRARLLHSQLMETPGLISEKDEDRDCYKRLDERCIGGFSCHRHPHSGKVNTTDVTAHCLHGMTDAYENIAIRQNGAEYILMHFARETESLSIKYERTKEAKLIVGMKNDSNLFIRIPGWTDKDSVKIAVDGREFSVKCEGVFAGIGHLKAGSNVCVSYSLPEKITTETTKNTEFTFKWKGDEIVGVSPNFGINPFYKTLEI